MRIEGQEETEKNSSQKLNNLFTTAHGFVYIKNIINPSNYVKS